MTFKMINNCNMNFNQTESIDDILLKTDKLYEAPSKLIKYNDKYIYKATFDVGDILNNTLNVPESLKSKYINTLPTVDGNNTKCDYNKEKLFFDENLNRWRFVKD